MGSPEGITSPDNLVEELYPGAEPLVKELRRQMLEVAYRTGLTTVLLEGPSGTGKTTMARALAMARMFAKISPKSHNKTVETAANEVRRGRPPLRWYRDISLAGLSDNLVEMQLFGIGQDRATEVGASIGIFEQAMTGYIDPKSARKKHSELYEDEISRVTGGVVLLDEIGDLSDKLQAKLLRTLNGEIQYRVGMEGIDDYGFKFHGLAILATWKDVDSEGLLREDLRQRICQYRINVPTLSSYPYEARIKVIESVIGVLQDECREELLEKSFIVDKIEESKKEPSEIFNPEWQKRIAQHLIARIKGGDIRRLAEVDWSKIGELRGLRNVLRQMLSGTFMEEALTRTQRNLGKQNSQPLEDKSSSDSNASAEKGSVAVPDEFAELRRYFVNGVSVSEAWKKERYKWTSEILKHLKRGSWQLMKILEETGKDPHKLKKELENLKRSKKKK